MTHSWKVPCGVVKELLALLVLGTLRWRRNLRIPRRKRLQVRKKHLGMAWIE